MNINSVRIQIPALALTLVGAIASTVLLSDKILAQEKSLYERLGGYEAISVVVDDFAPKLFADPVVGKRFFGPTSLRLRTNSPAIWPFGIANLEWRRS